MINVIETLVFKYNLKYFTKIEVIAWLIQSQLSHCLEVVSILHT